MKMKKLMVLLLLAVLLVSLSACSGLVIGSSEITAAALSPTEVVTEPNLPTENQGDSVLETSSISVEFDTDDLDASTSSAGMTYIRLEGDAVSIEGNGASADGSTVTITSSGMFNISGVLADGQLIVDSEDDGTIKLVLDGADITCSTSAPIYVLNAGKVVITLAEGSQNSISDGSSYVFSDSETDEPDAAIFSKSDLTINGSGALVVNASYKDGIASKDDLKIVSGTITINAVNDGIKGKDAIAVMDGVITIYAGADGMQANNAEDADKGYISIDGGSFDITSALDGIQAESNLVISGGTFTIAAGGGSSSVSYSTGWDNRGMPNSTAETRSQESTKGLKAGVDITIAGGEFNIDSADDSIHSNNSITIDSGAFELLSGDDGIHADTSLEINAGELTIMQSYEGLESMIITINDGTIYVTAFDDALNGSNGSGDSMFNSPAMQGEAASGDCHLTMNGGYLVIDAGGDGIDVNGGIDMSGGLVIVNGPTNDGNGALDYLGTFNMNGGFLVMVGSSGMAEAPSDTSKQYSLIHTYSSVQAAGSMVQIQDDQGGDILTFVPSKQYQSVLVSSPALQNGLSYTIYSGGSSTGAVMDGLYSGGTYTPGTQITSYTISGAVTGTIQGGGGFPRGPGDRTPPQSP